MKTAFLNEYETKIALSEFILKTNKFSMDVKCAEFEREFSIKQQRKYSVLFNSGGSANLAILQALKNLGRLTDGDEIGFSAVTWSTNVMPIIQTSMRPIPIDCTPETLNVMSHNLIDRLKTNNIRALFLTNVLGFVGDIDKIKEICDTRGIILIEDNCESLGTELPTGKAGNFGVGASFSFFVAHHMSTIEGGMVCTDDEELAEMLKITRANGWDRNLTAAQQLRLRRTHGIKSEFEAKYTFYDLGFNFRPTEITGFLGLFQLQFLDATIKTRRSNFLKFQSVSLTNSDFLHLKHDHINILSTFALPIVCKSAVLRARYMAQFAGAGVEIRPMIAGNLQRQPFYRKYVTEFFSLPGSDFLHDNGFYCGNYPELSQSDIETIMSCLHPHHT